MSGTRCPLCDYDINACACDGPSKDDLYNTISSLQAELSQALDDHVDTGNYVVRLRRERDNAEAMAGKALALEAKVEEMKAENMSLKISRNAALSRETEANRDWSTAAREWMIFRNNIFDSGENFFPSRDWAEFCNVVDWCNTCGRPLSSCGCGPEHPEPRG